MSPEQSVLARHGGAFGRYRDDTATPRDQQQLKRGISPVPAPVAGRRKRLLFVADHIPYPLDRGSHIRIHNILEACAAEFDVTFLAPRSKAQADAQLPASITRAVLVDPERPPPFSWKIFLQAARFQIGMSLGRTLRARMLLLHALAALDPGSFDLIFAERPHIGLLLRQQRQRTVVDFDDLEHRKFARSLRTQSASLSKLYTFYRYLIYRWAEQQTFREYPRVFVCSQEDQGILESSGARNVRILTNGASIPDQPGTLRQRKPGEPLRVVFVGNVGYAPNLDAIRYFAEEICPLAGSLVESFAVIGPNATPDLAAQFAGRVKFRGFVPDLGAALAEYDVMVAPIRFGGGTKLKVLDAMAHGIPVLTTGYGAEGLNLADGRSALIADSPDAMVRALGRLVRTPKLGATLAANAYDLAREHFSWSRTQATLTDGLRTLANGTVG